MTRAHGNKRYFQLLLDPNRAALLEKLAKDQDARTTALMRDVLYTFLAACVDEDVYKKAYKADKAVWKQSVQNRVQGRLKAAAERAKEPATTTAEPPVFDWKALFGKLQSLHES